MEILLAALREWKCPACGGKGTYQQNAAGRARDEARGRPINPEFAPDPVTCKFCLGHGLHPTARAAIESVPDSPMSDVEANHAIERGDLGLISGRDPSEVMDDVDVVERLQVLQSKMELDGLYVRSNTAWLALEEIGKLRRLIAVVDADCDAIIAGVRQEQKKPFTGLTLSPCEVAERIKKKLRSLTEPA